MKYNTFCHTFFIALFCLLTACGGGGGGGAAAPVADSNNPVDPVTPAATVKTLTVNWDYQDATYLSEYDIDGIKVYIGDTEVCSTEDVNVLNSTKTMTCNISAHNLTTPISFTITAYDSHGYESPKSNSYTIS